MMSEPRVKREIRNNPTTGLKTPKTAKG